MVVALAHNLHMKIVAEGVETAQQAALLRDMKCHYGQGYYVSRPLAAPAAAEYLTRFARAQVCAVVSV